MRADRGRAGEGDFGDAGAGGQRLTSFATEALDDVQYARRQEVTDDFDEYHDRQRGLLGRLEHDAVTGSQGRSQFPGGHQQREVPRDDLADNTQRLMEVIGRGVLVDLGGAAFLGADAASKVAEVVGSQRHVGVQGFTDGLAVVPGFSDSELFQVGFDAIGDLQQNQRAVLHRGLAPGIGSSVSGVQRLLDIFGARTRELGNDFTIYRRGVDEVLAFDRRDEFTTNVVAVARLEGYDGACGTGLGVDHDGPLFFCLSEPVPEGAQDMDRS